MSALVARLLPRLVRSSDGTAMIEFALIVSLLLLLTGGVVDFSLALYQFDKAAKAAALGARLAAVSDPIDATLPTRDPTASFNVSCDGSSATCSSGAFSITALQTIVYGRGRTTCAAVAAGQMPAMCNVYPNQNFDTTKVKVTYQQEAYATSGLGYAGRKGPVPTVTVEFVGVTFNLIFLNRLNLSMPSMATTVTGEDLKTTCTTGVDC